MSENQIAAVAAVAAVATVGIDIGKNSFHVIGLDQLKCSLCSRDSLSERMLDFPYCRLAYDKQFHGGNHARTDRFQRDCANGSYVVRHSARLCSEVL
jgi:hypothetical protein